PTAPERTWATRPPASRGPASARRGGCALHRATGPGILGGSHHPRRPHRMIRAPLALALAALPAAPPLPRQDQPGRPPSILVLLADDVSGKDFGCYGHPSIRTPNIDALAAGGIRLDNAFLTTSSCSPTRISVLTGKYPHATGAEDLHTPLPEHQVFVSTL